MRSVVQLLARLANTIYCSNCGHPNPSGSTYCNACGKMLNP